MQPDLSPPLNHRHTLLLIDDEEAILEIMTAMLADEGYDLLTAGSAEEALTLLKASPNVSLIISDQLMPGMTGVQFFAQARHICPDALRVLLTGYTDTDAIIDAINRGGIHQYLTKPWRREELLHTIRQMLGKAELMIENRRLDELVKKQNAELLELNKSLEEKVQLKTRHLNRSLEELQSSLERIRMILEGTVLAMSRIVESRDPYTAGHEQQVARIACIISERLLLPVDQVEAIRVAGQLHDIGKISVPSEILTKPGRLSPLEMEMVKTHCQNAYDILKAIAFPYPVAKIILQHHERMNGSGYPQGLKGEEILLEARIIGVADVMEAISSHRPYRPAKDMDTAIREITENRGTLYDTKVVDACLDIYTLQGPKGFLP
ncbi:MAG TPA: HD domain-containing phosphohydrolase [Smithellaceae bacterium]|nr:HD domain-containing phosphohydrolase [Smithellaceae bacterium]HRS82995.1 HD domain-containing phosphohydrolase [Smithellaceae bacterium]HRV44601.1 HD domain-containing phosphohydrolase [Smithellaceae bacterium]